MQSLSKNSFFLILLRLTLQNEDEVNLSLLL